MPILKFEQNQLVTATKRGWRSFDAQFSAKASDVFDVALERARTLVEERGNLTWEDWQVTPKSYSTGPGGLSGVIRGCYLKQMLKTGALRGGREKRWKKRREQNAQRDFERTL